MLDLHSRIAMLKRPSLLARAARFGIDDYRRTAHLRPLLHCTRLPRHGDAILQLLDLETEIDALRVAGAGHYSPAKHVNILIAIAGEARLLQNTRPKET